MCVALLGLGGCGGRTGSTGSPATPTPRRVAVQSRAPATPPPAAPATPTSIPVAPTQAPVSTHVTPTTVVSATVVSTGVVPTATPAPTPTVAPPGPAPTPAVVRPAELLSAAVRPTTLAPGQAFTATVGTQGSVRAVQIDIGSGAPTAPPPRTYTLTQVSLGSWSGHGVAPAQPGQYHFTVRLLTPGGALLRDNDAWNLQVGDAAGAAATRSMAQAQPAPPELLAPPFSYGYPVPASFSAVGRTVSGSEVISNARPDITPATVATYYTTHLPRAGWSMDSSAVPPPGSTTFSISATSGTRVCLVQYSGATVHVFYGTVGR